MVFVYVEVLQRVKRTLVTLLILRVINAVSRCYCIS